MPQTRPLSKFDFGPSIQTVMTVEMLQLLKRAAAFTAANAGVANLSTEEHCALYNFCGLVDDTVKAEQENSNGQRLTHLLCL